MSASVLSNKNYSQTVIEQAVKVCKQVENRHAKWIVNHKYLLDQNEIDPLLSQQGTSCDTNVDEKGRIADNQRILLACEQMRVNERQFTADIKQARHSKILAQTLKMAIVALENRCNHPDMLRVLNVHTGFADFASFAYGPNLTFQKLGSLTLVHNSFAMNILELVNNPRFCKQTQKKPSNISDAKTAIGFIGIENCRMLSPLLMAKPLLNLTDKNTKLIAAKMWQHSIIMANVTRMRLQHIGYKEPDEGVLLGVLRGLGQFAICNHFTHAFEDALVSVMQTFREKEQMDDYFACADIKPSLSFLPAVIEAWEKPITKRIIEHMDWSANVLHLKIALEEDLNNVPVHARSKHGAALGQARTYAIFDTMARSNAFLNDDTGYWFANMRMDNDMIKMAKMSQPGKFTLAT